MTADVTVVTVSWEAGELTCTCLDALREQDLDGLRMDVIVVDNGSTDGTTTLIRDRHPWVRVLRSEVNLGFAGGNNLALRTVTTPSVILLNNDAQPERGFVAALVRASESADDDVAAVAATVVLAERFRPAAPGDDKVIDGPDGRWVPGGEVRLVNSTGNEIRTDGFGVDRGWLATLDGHHPARPVFGFSGAAALLRRSALSRVGLFDESFFMYYEDSDLSWRLRLAGYRVEHCPAAVVSHVHAASSREGSAFFQFHDARNRLAMLTKNATAGLAVRAVSRFVVTTTSIAVRRSQPWSSVRTRCRVLFSYAAMLPGLLAARRRIGRDAVVPRRAVEDLLVAPLAHTGPYRSPTPS